MTIPTMTLIAGINGAGKTSLYHVLSADPEMGYRVNIDEIVRSRGSWQDTSLQVSAGREALQIMNGCIDNRKSFHMETTLPGLSIRKLVQKAKKAGFFIRMYFVGIDDVNIAIERVHHRVEMGGHGIADAVIRRRYEQLIPNLRQLLPLCDETILFDNTVHFRQIALLVEGEPIDCDRNLPSWFIDIMDDLNV